MIENTLSYLLTGSHDVLPSSYSKLRSYLNTHSENLAEQHQLQLFKKNSRCPYCCTPWESELNSFKLVPAKKLKTRAVKVRENKTSESRNTLVLKCRVCKQRSPFSLIKKKYISQNIQKEDDKIVKKKKKKKDKLSGLLVNLKNVSESSPSFFIKKKEGLRAVEDTKIDNPIQISETCKKFQSKPPGHIPVKSKSQTKNDLNNKLLNPSGSLNQSKISQKKNHKLKQLKKAIKENDNAAKKTLKDFLNLI